jgi:hypothetical protein
LTTNLNTKAAKGKRKKERKKERRERERKKRKMGRNIVKFGEIKEDKS